MSKKVTVESVAVAPVAVAKLSAYEIGALVATASGGVLDAALRVRSALGLAGDASLPQLSKLGAQQKADILRGCYTVFDQRYLTGPLPSEPGAAMLAKLYRSWADKAKVKSAAAWFGQSVMDRTTHNKALDADGQTALFQLLNSAKGAAPKFAYNSWAKAIEAIERLKAKDKGASEPKAIIDRIRGCTVESLPARIVKMKEEGLTGKDMDKALELAAFIVKAGFAKVSKAK